MSHELMGVRHVLYDGRALEAVVGHMARTLAGLLSDCRKLAIVGVLRRGAPLADRLTEALISRHGFSLPLRFDLSVKRYADDLTLLYPETRLLEEPIHAFVDLRDHTVLLVDDVLHGGFSLLKTSQYLLGRNCERIVTACLVDRRTAVVPIRLDVAGITLQVPDRFIVECCVPPYEGEFKIGLVEKSDLAVLAA